MPQLQEYINKLERNDLLIPDFQRGYVWKREQQKDLIASVLSGLPLGSLLIVEGSVNDFLATKLGTNIQINPEQLNANTAKYLVDGQQRLTTLVNVFSNEIHRFAAYDEDSLKGSTLNLRWVLKIPRPQFVDDENDVFKVRTLDFDRNAYIPTVDLLDYIDAETRRYAPSNFSEELPQERAAAIANSFVTVDRENYIIPLFLFCDENKRIILSRELFGRELPAAITQDLIASGIISDQERHEWRQNATPYCNDLFSWIQSNVDNLNISEVNFSAHERERAIEAYECMNRGGVSLSVFDLLIAKASREDRQFLTHFVEYIENDTPDRLNTLFGFHTTGTRKFIDDSSKSKDFIHSFRNLLGLYCGGSPQLRFTKENYILNEIDPEDIINSYKPIIDAMESAASFLMEKCGIIEGNPAWKSVQYKMMFNVVAYYYLHVCENGENPDACKLDTWWWSALFSAQFSRLANAQMIDSIGLLLSDRTDFIRNLTARLNGNAPQSLFEGDLVGEAVFSSGNPLPRKLKASLSQFKAARNADFDLDNPDFDSAKASVCEWINVLLRDIAN